MRFFGVRVPALDLALGLRSSVALSQRDKSSSTVDRCIQPQPMILK
jgi:hypothetical protein